MKIELPDFGVVELGMLIAGVVTGVFFVGIASLGFLSVGLSTSNQALVLATVLGSVGTLLLALATFINIFQTNRALELREKDRKKSLVIDELSNLIQPAIVSLESNLRQIQESGHSGCAFEWVYIRESNLYSGGRGPESVRATDPLLMARLAADNQMLSAALRIHDIYVKLLGEEADNLHAGLKPEIKRLLDAEGIDDLSQSLKVVSSAVSKELDHFGESHELYDFWERHREHLINYANEETTTTVGKIKTAEQIYKTIIEISLLGLIERKAKLKQKYKISEDEVTSTSDGDIFDM